MNNQSFKIYIDGKVIEINKGETVLDAALKNDIYIPTLCHHPDLPSFGACGLCIVEIEGFNEPKLACNTLVEQDIKITTTSQQIKETRQKKLAEILTNHPHACLVCAEREGCARESCSLNVPVDERCCIKLGDCELQRVADYIKIREDISRYKPKNLPIFDNEPIIIRDYNLCIGCGRCIRACNSIRRVNTLGDLPDPPKLIDSSDFPKNLKDNDCRFCGLCIDVCPTGALIDTKDKPKDFSPCQESCPAHIDISRFLREIAEEKYVDALKTIYKMVPFPGTLGWICNYPCEETCRRSELDDPVSIRFMKRLAFEKATLDLKNKDLNSGKKVAIVGAGPAGLSCAFYLAQLGHNVTIFEEKSKPGGMLRYGIPSFRLPREVFEKEIKIIQKMGIDIKFNTKIKSTEELFKQGFNAIFVGIGAQNGITLNIEGEDNPRVIEALKFLNNFPVEINSNDTKLGKQVAVIGGGNTAIDAARTALRLGSKVTIFYRRSENEMPAYQEEIKEAKKDGINFRFLSNPISIHPNINRLKIEFIKMKLGQKDQSGRARPIPIKNSNFSDNFDNIIIAIGQKVNPLKDININSKGWIDYNNDTLTIKPGVFIGGDAVGPSSVVEAVAMGRESALQIHKYLGGKEKDAFLPIDRPIAFVCSSDAFLKKREKIPTNEEACRCNQCDLRIYLSDIPNPPEDILPFISENISIVPEKAGVYILYNEDKNIKEIKGVSNLHQILKEKLTKNQGIKFFKFEEYPMYSKRESELLQQYIQQHGQMPGGSDNLDDLF
jgi:NADPH-dependent glutamate synthase beta subunit-like oxidoreductase/ferredoxin